MEKEERMNVLGGVLKNMGEKQTTDAPIEKTDDDKGKTGDKVTDDTNIDNKAKEAPEEKKKDQDDPVDPKEVDKELSDSELLDILKKRGIGASISSLEELKPVKKEPTEEELAQEREKRESDKVSYGLKSGKITKKQYDGYVSALNDPEKIAYDIFKADLLAQAKEDGETFTEEEITEAFDEAYHLNEDEKSAKFKSGKRSIERIAENFIRENFGSVLALDKDYSDYEMSERSKLDLDARIQTETPVFKRHLDEAFAKAGKVTIDGVDIPISSEVVTSVKEVLGKKDFIEGKIKEGYTSEEIDMLVSGALYVADIQNIAKAYNEAKREDYERGIRGLPPVINGIPKIEDKEKGKEKKEKIMANGKAFSPQQFLN